MATFIKLTTVEGEAVLVNIDNVTTITKGILEDSKITYNFLGAPGGGISDVAGITFVKETLDEIMKLLEGDRSEPRQVYVL